MKRRFLFLCLLTDLTALPVRSQNNPYAIDDACYGYMMAAAEGSDYGMWVTEKDCDLFKTSYNVKLDNGLELSFNKNGGAYRH